MPIQGSISVAIACPGAINLVKDSSPRDIDPSSSAGDSSIVTAAEIPGPTMIRHDSSLDLTEDVPSTWHLTTISSANGTVEDIYYSDQDRTRLEFLGTFFIAPEYDARQDSITGRINPGCSVNLGCSVSPGCSVNPGSPATVITLARPLVKFIPSVVDKVYCVIIKVLPTYVFENPAHDFLRFTLYIDGRERVARTVSARQMAEIGGDRSWTAAIKCQQNGANFYWKDITVKEDEELEEHEAWNYDLGTIRVYVERMREEAEEVSKEDAGAVAVAEDVDGEEGRGKNAGGLDVVEEEEDEEERDGEGVDFNYGVCREDESDEDVEMEDAEEEEGDDDDCELIMSRVNVEERYLSHFTATFAAGEPAAVLGTAAGRSVDGQAFIVFDFKYRSSELLPMVAIVPQSAEKVWADDREE